MNMVDNTVQQPGVAQDQVGNVELYDIADIGKLQERIKDIEQNKLQTLFDEADAIQERIKELAKLPDKIAADRERAILEANDRSVRAEIAKRSEDAGTLTNAIFALLDKLGLQTQEAGDETQSDIAKREAAKEAFSAASLALAAAKLKMQSAEGAWFFKGAKIEAAKSEIETKQKTFDLAEIGLADIEEQIKADARDRIRNASLAENFALLRKLTEKTVKIRQADVDASIERADSTQKSLASALEKRLENAKLLEQARNDLDKVSKELETEERALNEIPDQSSPLYAQQSIVVAGLQQKLTELKGQELALNSDVAAKTLVIEASRSMLTGLRVQIDTGKVNIIKLQHAEKNATILGLGIDRMVKNSIDETAADKLDMSMDKMVITSVELGIQAEVASAEMRNQAIKRYDEMMEQLHKIRTTGDEAMAKKAQDYLELDAKIREGYKQRGVDIEMSNLGAAASMIAKLNTDAAQTKPVAQTEDVLF